MLQTWLLSTKFFGIIPRSFLLERLCGAPAKKSIVLPRDAAPTMRSADELNSVVS